MRARSTSTRWTRAKSTACVKPMGSITPDWWRSKPNSTLPIFSAAITIFLPGSVFDIPGRDLGDHNARHCGAGRGTTKAGHKNDRGVSEAMTPIKQPPFAVEVVGERLDELLVEHVTRVRWAFPPKEA